MSSRPRSFLAIFATMRSAKLLCVMTLCALMLCNSMLCAAALAAPPTPPATLLPRMQANQPKVAAYFEAGPYWEFSLLQKEIIKALQQRGVAQHIVFPNEFHISPGWDAPDSVYRAEARKLIDLEKDEKSGGYVVRTVAG